LCSSSSTCAGREQHNAGAALGRARAAVTEPVRKSFLEQSPFDEVSMGIAHELSHLVLDSVKHPLRRCEKAVDLTAMMLGFRCLFATGTYKEIRLKDHIEVRQQGYLSPEEVRQADQIIEEYQDTLRPTQPQTKGTIDLIRQVQIRLAQLKYLVARLDFGERLSNLLSNRLSLVERAAFAAPMPSITQCRARAPKSCRSL
jgi:hypothetical protein